MPTTPHTAALESALRRAHDGCLLTTAEVAVLGGYRPQTAIKRLTAAGITPARSEGGRHGQVWRAEDALRLYRREI